MKIRTFLLLMIVSFGSAPALAEDEISPAPAAEESASVMMAANEAPDEQGIVPSPDFALSDEELSHYRGAKMLGDISIITSEQMANMSNNSVKNSQTGANVIGDNALNIQGIGMVVQNTGNNVIVQNSLQMNVTFQD